MDPHGRSAYARGMGDDGDRHSTVLWWVVLCVKRAHYAGAPCPILNSAPPRPTHPIQPVVSYSVPFRPTPSHPTSSPHSAPSHPIPSIPSRYCYLPLLNIHTPPPTLLLPTNTPPLSTSETSNSSSTATNTPPLSTSETSNSSSTKELLIVATA